MDHWSSVVVPQVFTIISSKISQRDACVLSSVNTFSRRFILSHEPLWKVLDLRGTTRVGERLAAAIALPQFKIVEEINLEFAQGLEDNDLQCLDGKKEIRRINLNACQGITDMGMQIVAKFCSKLNSFSIYWNLRITDNGVETLLKHCKELRVLNLSGCKGVTDRSLEMICTHSSKLESLNLTRCVRLTDDGLMRVLESCKGISELYLYALSSLTDKSYAKLGNLQDLKILDLCGAQNLTDDGLSQGLARCKVLQSLNFTWCVKVTDRGIKAINEACYNLQCLSLHGLLGVTDETLENLSSTCSATLTTIDVNGCSNIRKRSKVDLLRLFPHLRCFHVHS